MNPDATSVPVILSGFLASRKHPIEHGVDRERATWTELRTLAKVDMSRMKRDTDSIGLQFKLDVPNRQLCQVDLPGTPVTPDLSDYTLLGRFFVIADSVAVLHRLMSNATIIAEWYATLLTATFGVTQGYFLI